MDELIQFCFLYLTTKELLHSKATLILHGMDGQVVTILACVLIINVKYLITLTSIL